MHYRRFRTEGGTYFLTLVTFDRKPILVTNIEKLREAFLIVMKDRPFTIEAHVILPDHLHMIWTLPESDSDYPTRWRLIKHYFSRMMDKNPGEVVSPVREAKKERQIWQRRYWEHIIRDEADLNNHIEYIHYNPMKHGLVDEFKDWEYSSFHRYVREGFYPARWLPNEIIKNADYSE
jgi:putative transposase